jgi:hypothetical protein
MTGASANGVAASASGFTTCGTPSRVAIAAQSRLWRPTNCTTPAGSPSATAAVIAAGSSTGVDEPHAALGREGVARTRHRLTHHPGQSVVLMVKDTGRHAPGAYASAGRPAA